jgi:hypothetical protein
VEGRYVAVFLILLMGELLVKVPKVPWPAAPLASIVMVGFMLLQILVFNLSGAVDLSDNLNRSTEAISPPSWPGATAERLYELGLQPGDKVGVIGYAFDSFWARLGRFQIVAEMLGSQATPFWFGDALVREAALQAFTSTGVKAVVAEGVPTGADLTNWHQVDESDYYIYLPDGHGN